MEMEQRQIVRKRLFRLMYPALKWIIGLIGLMYLFHLVVCYVDSPMEILSYLGGLSVLTFLFLLIATFTLHFRMYHRIPLYFAMTVEVVNWVDFYAELPWDSDGYFLFMFCLTGVYVIMALWSFIRSSWRGHQEDKPLPLSAAESEHQTRRDRFYYKLELSLLKVIPMVIAGMYVFDTVLYCLDISMAVPSFLFGTSLLPLLFIYLSSYVFQFCTHHRIFIYYVFFINLLNYLSLYPTFQFSDTKMVAIQLIIAGVSLFLILYFYVKNHQKAASAAA